MGRSLILSLPKITSTRGPALPCRDHFDEAIEIPIRGLPEIEALKPAEPTDPMILDPGPLVRPLRIFDTFASNRRGESFREPGIARAFDRAPRVWIGLTLRHGPSPTARPSAALPSDFDPCYHPRWVAGTSAGHSIG